MKLNIMIFLEDMLKNNMPINNNNAEKIVKEPCDCRIKII